MNRKKALSLLLAAAMTFTMSAFSFAAETTTTPAPVEAVEESQSANQSVNSQSTSTKTISADNYAVVVSYNSAVSFTGKKLNVNDLDSTVTVYNTVSGQISGNAVLTASLKGKFEKSTVAQGKATGSANFAVTSIKAAKKTSKDGKKAVKAINKTLKKAGNKLGVEVMALSLSSNGVVSANNIKKKEVKSKLTSASTSTNYIISVKYNTKKLEKSKVTVYYAQTKANGKKVVKSSKLKNGKNGVKIEAVSGNVVVSGSVEAVLSK